MTTLFDLDNESIGSPIPLPRGVDGLLPWIDGRRPALFDGFSDMFPEAARWSYQWFADRLETIRMQRPQADDVFHYLSFERIPMTDFDTLLGRGENVYALEPLKGQGVAQTFPEDLRIELPEWVPADRFRVSNLYVGPGGNRSLLHYDETHSLLTMVEGRKRFVLFPPTESGRMYGYGIHELRALRQGRMLDSRLDCGDIDVDNHPSIGEARGITGWLEAGQTLLIPAGTWHFIEAEGRNVSVNYFWFQNRLRHWLAEPLRSFWVKKQILRGIDLASRLRDKLSD